MAPSSAMGVWLARASASRPPDCSRLGRAGAKSRAAITPVRLKTFGRDLRAALHWLKLRQPRLGDERLRVYEGIRLR
jgi:hypothetical protein